MRLRRHVLVLGSLAAAAAAGAQQTPEPYVEKVEVRVRSVLVFITDAKGNPLAAPPKPGDLRVIENGAVVEVVAVEPARSVRAPRVASQAPPETPAPTSAPATTASPLPQYLYVDTTALQTRSVVTIARTVEKNLDVMLANGPLEIVVADPEPKVMLPSTSDAEAVRKALELLPKTAVGKNRLGQVRRETLTRLDGTEAAPQLGGGAKAALSDVRAGVREELALVRNSLDRLEQWASTLPADQPAVLYLCNDGFDSDPTEVYRLQMLDGEADTARRAQQLQLEFGGDVPEMIQKTSKTLAGRGITAIMFAFGGSQADFAQSAANLHKMGSNAIRRPLGAAATFYYARPFEPLLRVADQTGGQVVSATSRLPKTLDDIGGAYLVSFRSRAPADGQPHPLEVSAVSASLRVRAPRSLLAGTPRAASAGQAVRALSLPSAAGTLPVTAAVTALEKLEKGRAKGSLVVSADLASIAEALERTGPGRIRVTVAVENSKGPPFTHSEEMDLDHSGEGTVWYYESSIVWPSNATRVAVTVEELKTGTAGSAVVELPRP